MVKRNRVSSRQYTDEFKLEAVRLAETVGPAQAAKRLGIPDSSLGNWRKRKDAGKLVDQPAGAAPIKRGPSELEAENSRLRRELASAKLDLEIVKKAAAYFASQSR
jgi:transposase